MTVRARGPQPSLRLRVARQIIRQTVRRAARSGIANREMTDMQGRPIRWIGPEIRACLAAMDAEAVALRRHARFDELDRFGNRLMVEMAVWTAAADRALRKCGISPESARQVVADLGWNIYRRMLSLTSLPVRLATRDPGRRLRWTIRILLVFPFSAPGAPGYEVQARREGDDILTHFTCCPPQSFVRRVAEAEGDSDALESFRRSWCTYDWPGADLIARDASRGHYRRPHTLSHGDSVCDMCWAARALSA